jgi:hypothetical protein
MEASKLLYFDMDFTPVNDLERLLVQAAGDPAARAAFVRAMLESDVFFVREGAPPETEGSFVANTGTTFEVRRIEMEGVLRTPIFSSVDRISAVVTEPVGYIALKGRDMFETFRGSELVLNPGSPYGKYFTPGEIEAILDGSIFNPTPSQLDVGVKEILLGQPSVFPVHITDALKQVFADMKDVSAAYLAHAVIAGVDSAPHTMIGIATTGDWRSTVEPAGRVVERVAKPGELVDFVQIKPDGSDVISSYLLKSTTPFYVRKKKKRFGLF